MPWQTPHVRTPPPPPPPPPPPCLPAGRGTQLSEGLSPHDLARTSQTWPVGHWLESECNKDMGMYPPHKQAGHLQNSLRLCPKKAAPFDAERIEHSVCCRQGQEHIAFSCATVASV